MTSTENSNKKALYKFIIPAILVLALIGIISFVMISGNKPADKKVDSKVPGSSVNYDLQASELEKPKNEGKLSDKEDDKKSQQINSLLKVKRQNPQSKTPFVWYQGWWDVTAKKQCNSDGTTIAIPKIPADAAVAEIPKERLGDIVKVPSKPEKKNHISYPTYKVEVPLIYTNLEDRFEKNKDGTINFNVTVPDDSPNSALQQKLKKGVILEPMAPQPGETGNSYISGHTSNYSFVDSNYNQAFKPLESKTKVGEKFFVYDCEGRKLVFDVFESKEIKATDSDEAWKDYPDKRVVTLQGSVLKTCANGFQQDCVNQGCTFNICPTHRWLTRGTLNVEESKKANQ
jgi:sortase (surface protein transpeptidase)